MSVPTGELGPTVTAENTQQNSSGEHKLVMYNANIMFLNRTNNKDSIVYMLRGLSAEEFLTCVRYTERGSRSIPLAGGKCSF